MTHVNIVDMSWGQRGSGRLFAYWRTRKLAVGQHAWLPEPGAT
jgi:hypothetical protein